MRERIYKSKLYIVGIRTWPNGDPGPFEPAIITGAKLRTNRAEYLPWTHSLPAPVSSATFRLDDGHVPDYQERGGIERVTEFLANEPYQAAYFTTTRSRHA